MFGNDVLTGGDTADEPLVLPEHAGSAPSELDAALAYVGLALFSALCWWGLGALLRLLGSETADAP